MSILDKLRLPDGTLLEVEVETLSRSGTVTRGAPASQVIHDFAGVLPVVRGIAGALWENLQEMTHKPDSVGVEFGLKIGGEAGIILTKGTAEANVKLSLSWKTGG